MAPSGGAVLRRRTTWICAGMLALSAMNMHGQGLEGAFAPNLANNAFVTRVLPLQDGRFLIQGGTLVASAPDTWTTTAGIPLKAGGTVTIQGVGSDGIPDDELTAVFGLNPGVAPFPDGSFINLTAPRFVQQDGSAAALPRPVLLNGSTLNAFPGLVPHPDGGVVVFGVFTSVNGVPVNGWVRLDAKGFVDMEYTTRQKPPANFRPAIQAGAALSDGSSVFSGRIVHPPAVVLDGMVRVLRDGTVDPEFHSPTNSSGQLLAPSILLALPGGGFLAVHGDDRPEAKGPVIRRYAADGTPDAAFPGVTFDGEGVSTLALQPDGRILAGGNFTKAGNIAASGLCRFDANGVVDATFVPAIEVSAPPGVLTLTVLDDGRLAVGGFISSVNGQAVPGVAMLRAFDPQDSAPTIAGTTANRRVGRGESFTLSVNAGGHPRPTFQWYRNGEVLPNATNSFVVATESEFSPEVRYRVVASNASGQTPSREILVQVSEPAPPVGPVEIGRSYPTPPGAFLSTIVPDRSGGLLLDWMDFSPISPEARPILRLLPSGAPDEGFQSRLRAALVAFGPDVDFKHVAVDHGNRIIAMAMNTSDASAVNGILLRFAADGTLDPEFVRSSPSRPVAALALAPDNAVILLEREIAGATESEDEYRLYRLRPDGVPDPTFDSSTPLGYPPLVVVQPDGRILSNRKAAPRQLVRLRADGKPDDAFVEDPAAVASSLVVLPDGRLAGLFGTVASRDLRRLLPDGKLDATFTPTHLSSQYPTFGPELVLLPDGGVVTSQSTLVRNGRIHGPWLHFWPDGTLDGVEPGMPPGTSFSNGSSLYNTGAAWTSDGTLWLSGFPAEPGVANGKFLVVPASLAKDSQLARGFRSPGRFEVRLPLIIERTYTLERSASLESPVWTKIATVPGDGFIGSLVDPAASGESGFYRIGIR